MARKWNYRAQANCFAWRIIEFVQIQLTITKSQHLFVYFRFGLIANKSFQGLSANTMLGARATFVGSEDEAHILCRIVKCFCFKCMVQPIEEETNEMNK